MRNLSVLPWPKYLWKKDKIKIVHLIIFSIFFLAGINSYDDYGVSIDEYLHYTNGQHYYSFFKGLFFESNNYISANELRESWQFHHFKDPAIFDFIIAFIVDLFQLKNLDHIFYIRHLLIFLIFYLGVFYFFLILKNYYNDSLYTVFGILLLILSPRIFAESFYNNKDLIFLSITCIFFYYSINFFLRPSYLNAIYFGIFSALAFDIRIMAVIYIFTFYLMFFLQYLDNKKLLINNLKFLSIAIIFTILFTYIFWPYLWIDPINNLIDFFTVIRGETPNMQNFYLGEHIFSKNIPWHYEILWIIITSPNSSILLFTLGYSFYFYNFFQNILEVEKSNHKFWHNKEQFIILYIFSSLTLSFLIKLKFGVTYNGWRQIYYLYPLMVFFSISGLKIILKNINKIIIKKIIFLLIFLELMYLAGWIYKNHPYQYLYFNPVFKSITQNNFDLDYWGISNKHILNKILEINSNRPFKVTTISYTNLNDSLRILPKNVRKKISIVYNVNDSDYVVDNYMKKWSSTIGEEKLKKNFKVVYNLKVDGNIVNTIYKRNN